MLGTSHTLQPEQSHYMQAAALESLPRVENALRDAALAAKEKALKAKQAVSFPKLGGRISPRAVGM